MPSPIWTHSDVGYHIDGAYGVDHARGRLFGLVFVTDESLPYLPLDDSANIMRALESPVPSDDDWESIEATEYLQSHTAEGLVWHWLDGDLILLEESEAE